MQLIRDLQELIEDEISDVKKYAKMAVELKVEYPSLAQALYNISSQEDLHQTTIHNEVTKIIQEHRKAHGEPPAAMMAVYEYLHKKSIDRLAEARRYQDMYKNA